MTTQKPIICQVCKDKTKSGYYLSATVVLGKDRKRVKIMCNDCIGKYNAGAIG